VPRLRRFALALYLSRVRSSDLLAAMPVSLALKHNPCSETKTAKIENKIGTIVSTL
jgi:hypothetical protein